MQTNFRKIQVSNSNPTITSDEESGILPTEIKKKNGRNEACFDMLCKFVDPRLRNAYEEYCLKQRSLPSIFIVTALITAWVLVETIASLKLDTTLSSFDFSYVILVFLLIVATWILSFLLIYFPCTSSTSDTSSSKFHSNIQFVVLIFVNLLFVVKMIKVIAIGSYSTCIPPTIASLDGFQAFLSNSTASSLQIGEFLICPPVDSFFSLDSLSALLIMSFCPLLLSAIFFEPRFYCIVAFEVIIGGLMMYLMYESIYSILPTIIILIILIILNYNLHCQRIHSFLTHYQLERILLEKEQKTADQSHAMEMKSMIGNVAHDLKTPLASFTTGVDLIENFLTSLKEKVHYHSNDLNPDLLLDSVTSVESCLANIRNTNMFMLMTINRCIDYTKASKGMKLVPKNETMDLREVIQFPIECMRNIQERVAIHLENWSTEKICSSIITDKQWLQENILCLLSNAVKYSTQGTVTINVSVTEQKDLHHHSLSVPKDTSRSEPTGAGSCSEVSTTVHTTNDGSSRREEASSSYLLFEIEDTGIGMSEEAMKSLFNPFRQAQRLAGGTGLGLYSLAKRVETLKGFYGVKARKDRRQGSLFWFAIPYRPDPSLIIETKKESFSKEKSEMPGSPNWKIPTIRSHSSSSLDILIVDDSPSIVKMSSMMLKRQGHQITTAENGAAALQKMEEKWQRSHRRFDLVLMDLQMPVMDGLEATRRLRLIEKKESSRGHQLIVGVSANSDHETMNEALGMGIDEFMSKPFSVEELSKTLGKHLGSSF